MNITTVALDTVWQDIDANIDLTEKHVARVLELFPKTDIILFPEISLVGCVEKGNQKLAQSLDGRVVSQIKAIAKKYNVALVCGLIEKNETGNPYNCAFVVSKTGEFVASYRKNHLFTESNEPTYYSPGDTLVTFDLEGWKCGLSICFDIRFPRLFAAYKQAGVEVMFSPNNWVDGRNKPAILEHLVKARAHENQYFFAAVDRSGNDPDTTYYGVSVIANPYAEDIARRSGIYSYAELDKSDIANLGKQLPLSGSFKPEYQIAHVS
jgi:predicted amidohydrolase